MKKREYIKSKKRMKKMIRDEEKKWIKERWEEVDKAKNMGDWWRAINKFRGKRRGGVGGKIEEREWVDHFKRLLNREEIREKNKREEEETREEEGETDKCMTDEITEKEVGKALGRMADGKATGEDGIPIECLKKLYCGGGRVLTRILNKIWEKGEMPKGWECARIVPIHKGGDSDDVGNYRGVALLDIGYKVLTNIMAERVNRWIEREEKLKESQAGFRRSRGTRDHIFVLNTVINRRLKNKRGKLYVAFVDLKAAFDSVNRELLMEKIWEVGIRGKMYKMIKEIYRENYAEIRLEKKCTERFVTTTGVRQGCALSATLFDIFIDDVDKEWEEKGIGGTNIGRTKIKAMKYADDIAVIAEDARGLKKMLKGMEKYMEKKKLKVNAKKTKVIVFRNGGRRGKKEDWEFNGEKIEEVKEYKYLGFWFNAQNNYNRQIAEVAQKAQKAANMTWGVNMRAGRVTKKEKMYLMRALVKPVMMYGVEIWGVGEIEKIEKMQARYCKYVLGVAKNTPGYIWRSELGERGIKGDIRERVCRYVRDVLNMNEERWPKVCMKEECRGIMNGNPSKWGKRMKEMCDEIGVSEVIEWIWREETGEKVYERMRKGVDEWKEKERREDWGKVCESTYNRIYKEIMPEEKGAIYLNKGRKKKEENITWARMRCGNVGRAFKKGQKEWMCRLCEREYETIEHLISCEEAGKIQREQIKERMDEWKKTWEGRGEREIIIEKLRGEVCSMLCEYYSKVEEYVRQIEGRR